jgi:uncharacterized protein
MNMETLQEELPLLDLFTRLREAGLPLGINEYHLILRALQEGFGTADQEALAELCRTLWVKSQDEEHLFNYHFQQLFAKSTSTAPVSSRATTSPEKPVVSNSTTVNSVFVPTPEPGKTTPPSVPVSSELMEVEDEIRVAKSVYIATLKPRTNPVDPFTQTDEYFPVTRRQMKQSWRHLRRFVREGLPTELDVEATIERVVQQGVLLEPILVPRRLNQTELLLLIDHKGSMVPFHALSGRFAETAQRGGRLGEAGIYYFHNCPTRYLYQDLARQKAEPVADVLAHLRPERSTVLIFSDAGAARGGLSIERLELTQKFLDQLKQRVRYVAWLNPMAKERWFGTTAGEIARFVPMFEFSRQGLDGAIDVLRGRGSHAQLEYGLF